MANLASVTVEYYENENGGTIRTLPSDSVQGVSWSGGRQNITDQLVGSTCQIFGRTTLPYPPSAGGRAKVTLSDGTNTAVYNGYIRDFRVIYGAIPSLDTWELVLEGPLARAGRMVGTISTSANTSTVYFAYQIATVINPPIGVQIATTGWGATTSAQTFTETQAANLINTLQQTEQGWIYEYSATVIGGLDVPAIHFDGRNSPGFGTTVQSFSDTGSAANYYEIEFLSSAYNYGTKIVVTSTGLADQTAGSGTYQQTFSTILYSTTEAANTAGYLKLKFDTASAVPYVIRFRQAADSKANLNILQTDKVGQNISILFRGTTYNAIIEGMSVSARPDGWVGELYLSSSLANSFLTLDSTVYGTLDYNKLGF